MAISTYSELQDAVANWLDRTDLTTRIPEFIALAEADINSELDIRTVETDQTLSLTSSNRTVALPTGFREALNLWPYYAATGREEPLRRIMPELNEVSTVQGMPSVWCVDGSNIAFDCPADQTYTYILRQRGGVALSVSATTNHILTNYPGVYLFGALREAGPYLRDPDLMAMFEGKYGDALAKARRKEGRDKGRVTLSTEVGAPLTGRRSDYNINTDR